MQPADECPKFGIEFLDGNGTLLQKLCSDGIPRRIAIDLGKNFRGQAVQEVDRVVCPDVQYGGRTISVGSEKDRGSTLWSRIEGDRLGFRTLGFHRGYFLY